MADVTAVVVYQHSMPWIDVVVKALCRYPNDRALDLVFVENVPNKSNGSKRAGRWILDNYHGGRAQLIQSNVNKIMDPGVRHAKGLSKGFHVVQTEWTLFLDADCIPIRANWLDHMFSQNADIVGPPAFHNLADYSMVHAHPSCLLFRTKLGRPPYWNSQFTQIRRHPKTRKRIFWDVCIGFTHQVGSRQDVTLKKLPQQKCNDHGCQYYRIDDIAIHMRGTTNTSRRRGYPNDHKQELLTLPEFAFYRETVKS